jgi:hypothetical protein
MPVFVNRIDASRESQRYGYEADTWEKAVLQSLKPENRVLTAAAEGTLLRIAIALERLADLQDPVIREKRREEAEKDRQDLERKQEREQWKQQRQQRLLPVLKARLAQLEPHLNALHYPVLATAIEGALRRVMRDAVKWDSDSLEREFLVLMHCPIEDLPNYKLPGIGPKKLARWQESNWPKSTAPINDSQ